MAKSDSFDRLPTEILELILGALGLDAEPQDLKSMRLVSRRAANSPVLNATLFKLACFFPIPEQVAHLTKLNFGDRIGVHVQQIRFMLYPFTASISQKSYKSLLISKWSQEVVNESDADLAENYAVFTQRAKDAQECLYSKQLRETWMAALKCCPNVNDVSFASLDGEDFHAVNDLKLWSYYPDSLNLRDDLHGSENEFQECEQEIAENGNQLFTVALECLAEAKISPESLNWTIEMSLGFDLDAVPRIHEVDLRKVHTVTIDTHFKSPPWLRTQLPLGAAGDEEYRTLIWEDDQQHEERRCVLANDTVHKLLRLVSQVKTLRILQSDMGWVKWPPAPDISLPNLETLEVRHVTTIPDDFCDFLRRHPTLRHLTLAELSPSDGDYGWFAVFEGLRTCPHKLHVVFDMILTDAAEFGDEFDTHPEGTLDPNFRESDDPDRYDILEDVVPYIRNEIPWTNFLTDQLGPAYD